MTDPSHAFLTEEGKVKLEEELQYLKFTKRKEVAEKIEQAKEMGDLSENAEYTAAKDEQAFMESRITELENLLHYATVAAAPSKSDGAGIGSVVTVVDPEGKERVYTIVGFNEASPATGKISNESPLGQAILGKRSGDSVSVTTPGGAKEYRIENVS